MRTISKWRARINAVTVAQETGASAENKACAYLQQQSLQLITRNFRCKMGEIDLIMQDKNELVFVEVRCRNNSFFGGGLDSITDSKQKKLIKAASFYLQQKRLTEIACRFDAVAISANTIEWIKNAF
jgi:putative endonuclease